MNFGILEGRPETNPPWVWKDDCVEFFCCTVINLYNFHLETLG
jgi:hypothetical protein